MFTHIARLFQINRLRLAVVLCSTAAYLLANIANIPAKANPQMPAPIQAQISLDGSPRIMLGEPIVLHYKIANVSDNQGVGIGLGTYKTQWCQLSLSSADGRSAQVIPDERPLNPPGLHSTGTYFLQPDGSEEDRLVVTRFFRILYPGRYTLAVHIRVPYVAEAVTEESALTSNLRSDIKANNKVLDDDFVFSLTVVKADPSVLKAKANSLMQSVTTEKDVQREKALLDALFSMPETQAASSWKSLANNADRMDAELIADQLARIHSITTADLLVQMLDSTKLSADETSYIKTKINQNYNSGDVGLKAHIKSLAANRGIEMSDEVAIPQPSD